MKLLRIRKAPRHEQTLVVEAGQVMCPRTGMVDVERCWICPAYDGFSTGHLEGVVCRASRGPESYELEATVR
jgi:hypothetical protein